MGTILVPDVRGRPNHVARKILKLAGLEHVEEVFIESKAAKNIVVAQDPLPNEIVKEDAIITLSVSKDSLVRYLPAIYQPGKPGESGFVTRFLWIFQHFFEDLNSKLDNMHNLFRPYSVPSEFLPWLASWFAVSFRPGMDEAARRKILKQAVHLFGLRGTAWEIQEMVRLQTGLDIEIVEKPWPYRGVRAGETRIGEDSMILPQMPESYCFIVKVPVGYDDMDLSTLLVLYEVLNSEKPAHTNYLIEFHGETGVREATDEAFIKVGMQAIGMGQAIGIGLEE